ncbi:MAG: SLC13 family permease [Hyphomicrobiales bacterium]|nr:MAG: SLC13 family permease [Hyphomicrobiales bacterium]
MLMWLTFAIILGAVILFATEWVRLEITSLGVITALLLVFHLFPVAGESGTNLLGAATLLSGFANPALITILALLVIGQGLQQTGALDGLMQILSASRRSASQTRVLLFVILAGAGFLSAFMNNTPVVVIFIPIVAALANRYGPGAGAVLLPLSYITILGGMTTLIGSSTNLLVAGLLETDHGIRIGFFDLMIPGLLLAGVGGLYVGLVMPRLLRRRAGASEDGARRSGKQFLARLHITDHHPMAGEANEAGLFRSLTTVSVIGIDRAGHTLLAPYEDVVLAPGDQVHISGDRDAVMALLKLETDGEHLFIAESAVAPGSRLAGQPAHDEAFFERTGCHLIGLQRLKRMKRLPMNRVRIRPGDVLLIAGSRVHLRKLRLNRDLMVLQGSVSTIRDFSLANHSLLIFGAVIAAAASGLVPMVLAATLGALGMLTCGCVNIQQAGRAIDGKIIMLIASSIAMALSLEHTGGAQYLADNLVRSLMGVHPAVILSALFLLTAVLTNVLSNNATALLLTPIAIGMAHSLNIPPLVFVHAIIFAANCSFASPIGYQTNLLVMAPGNYRFADYLRSGGPLVLVIWATFSLFAPWYYGLN